MTSSRSCRREGRQVEDRDQTTIPSERAVLVRASRDARPGYFVRGRSSVVLWDPEHYWRPLRTVQKTFPESLTRDLIAPCGMDCALCRGHLREKSMTENLMRIQAIGLEAFVAAEKSRWACPECGALLCVHLPDCGVCGHTRNLAGPAGKGVERNAK